MSQPAYSSVPPTEGKTVSPPPSDVSVDDAAKLKADGWRFLDVRMVEDFAKGHVPAAANIPYLRQSGEERVVSEDFAPQVTSLFERSTPLLVNCGTGGRSTRAAAALREMGFTHVANVLGGFKAWREKGYPTEP